MASGFSIAELLYPLTKGDVEGHAFHGNQWRTIESEGRTSTSRPPVGTFQLSDNEIKTLAELVGKEYTSSGAKMDAIAVSVSKMLGMDKPATVVTSSPDGRKPDFYRGCDQEGAESLKYELEHYGGAGLNKGGGAASGNGVYASRDINVANEYANNRSDGVVVQMWVDPEAKICSGEEAGRLLYDLNAKFSEANDRGDIDNQQLKQLRILALSPSFAAMSYGYQAVNTPDFQGGELVTLDRSILKIKLPKFF